MYRSIRVLILEDNPADAELMEYELMNAGIDHTSKLVMTEDAYVRGIQQFTPDIILSDYDLPQYNGALALVEAKNRCPDIPFILVTGAVSEDRAIEILTGGAWDYVLKNRLNRLVPAVQRALAEAREHKARKKAEEKLRNAHKALESKVRERTEELEKEIAERKSALEKLRESEEKFRSAFDFGAVPMGLTGLDFRILRVNAAFAEMVGYSEAELTGMNFIDITYPEDIPANEAGLARVVSGEKDSFRMEKRYIRKDGRIVWVDMSTSSVRDAEGRPLYIVTHAQDITERKKTEDTLKQSKQKIESILNAITDIYVALDQQWRFTELNPRAEVTFGKKKEELIGKVYWELYPKAAGSEYHEKLNVAMHERIPVHFEGFSVGMGKWYETYASPTEDGIALFSKDITKRKEIEEDLVKSESRFRTIFEQAPLGIALLDTQTGRFLEVNPKFCEILGRSVEELRRLDFHALTYPDDLSVTRNYNEQLIEGKLRHYNLEKRYFRSDGTLVWVRLTVIAMWAIGDVPLRHIAILEDITERKRSEVALRQSEARWKKTQAIAHLGSWELDVVNDKLSWSDEVYRIFGLQPQEFAATYEAFLEAVHPDDRETVDAVYTGSLREGRDGYEVEHRVVRKSDGGVRIVREKCEHLRDETGRVVRSIGMVHDITERKQAEEELKKSERLLRESNQELEHFSYSVSHDLQAPLRAIKGFSQMILSDGERKQDKKTERRLAVIRENADKMQHLIEGLLTLSRIGHQAVSSRKIDMNGLAGDAWKEIEAAYPEKALILKMKDLHPACGDQILIRQVLVNLLSNAVKYSIHRQPIEVEVGSYEEKNGNVYYIKDQGVGFDMKFHDKLFGAFQRLHSAKEFKGTGIGLSIAQRIVHLHGGRIWAEGKVDQGAVFYFLLPREQVKR